MRGSVDAFSYTGGDTAPYRLACNLIRNSLVLWLRQPPASKEDRMNNVLRNYS
jgi:hypothetical protein